MKKLTIVAKPRKKIPAGFASSQLMPTRSRPNRFNATVDLPNGKLLLSYRIAQKLHRLSIYTADELLAYTQTFPSALAHELGWSIASVNKAREELANSLEGIVPSEILHPVAKQFSYGARRPDIRK